MKRVIHFSRYRYIMIPISLAAILLGLVYYFVRGINLGIDFRGGMSMQIQVAPVAMTLSATGDAKVEASSYSGEREILGGAAIGFTVTKGADSQSFRFSYAAYPTLSSLAEAVRTVPGVTATVVGDPGLASGRLLPVDFPVDITQSPLSLNYTLESAEQIYATTGQMRGALQSLGDFDLQTLGALVDQQFILKMGVPAENEAEFRNTIAARVQELLGSTYKAGEIIIRKTDFVGPSLAGELTTQTISLVGVALALMLIYLSFRFKFEYALACVLCVIHDSAVMVTFVLLLGVEFSTSIIAAILTIIGYSVNDTIVIFDRVRENQGLMRDSDERLIFDTSLSQTLGRTLITSFVTLLSVVALYVFTSGSLKDFSLVLIVGIVVGSYSTIYIASPIVMGWHSAAKRIQRRQEAKKFGTALPKERQERRVEEEAEPVDGAEAAQGSASAAGAVTAAPGAAPEGARAGGESRGVVIRQQPSRKKKRKR